MTLVLFQLAGRPREGDLAAFDEIEPVGHLERHVGVLLDQQNGDPFRVQLADDVEDLLDDERRETDGRLVHEQDPGTGHQPPRDGQHLLLASRQGAGKLTLAFLQPGKAPVDVRHVGRDLRRGSPPGVCAGVQVFPRRPCAGTRGDSPAPAQRPWTPPSRPAAGSGPRRPGPRSRDVAERIPAMVNIVVVLPAPLGPSRQVISPSAASRLTPRNASMRP